MRFINIGGVGSCQVTEALKILNKSQERYPYDWLICSQSFILDTFENIIFKENNNILNNIRNHFFDFEDEKYIEGYNFFNKNKNAFSPHDIHVNFPYNNINAKNILEKYHRRFLRLKEALENTSNEDILFIRRTENEPYHIEWENLYKNESENFVLWQDFINKLNEKYKKNIKLLILTTNLEEYNQNKQYETDKMIIKYYNINIIDFNQEIYTIYNTIQNIL